MDDWHVARGPLLTRRGLLRAGLVGSAQKVATRSVLMSYCCTSRVFCGSAMMVFRKVTPALKTRTR
mgnify:CR=1 FL=1